MAEPILSGFIENHLNKKRKIGVPHAGQATFETKYIQNFFYFSEPAINYTSQCSLDLQPFILKIPTNKRDFQSLSLTVKENQKDKSNRLIKLHTLLNNCFNGPYVTLFRFMRWCDAELHSIYWSVFNSYITNIHILIDKANRPLCWFYEKIITKQKIFNEYLEKKKSLLAMRQLRFLTILRLKSFIS
jgi:hypothetical protein